MAGESAREKYESLRGKRHAGLRKARPVLVLLAVLAVVVGGAVTHSLLGTWWIGALFGLLPVANLLMPSQREVAWRKGAEGEATVARALDNMGGESWALHDRLIPGSRANLDHIFVGPTGVWTVDAKNYSGKLETRAKHTELWINGRNRSKLLEQAHRQQAVVRNVLQAAGLGRVPVHASLCFVGVEWPLFFAPQRASDVALLSPRRLRRLMDGDHVVPVAVRRQVVQALESHLVPAAKGGTATLSPSRPLPPPAPTAKPTSSNAFTPPPSAAAPSCDVRDLVVSPWSRYGKSRLYVNQPDGTTVGYLDRLDNQVSADNELDRRLVREAVAAFLANSGSGD